DGLLAGRRELEAELAGAAGGREAAGATLLRLRGAVDRAGLRRESAQAVLAAARADLAEARALPPRPRPEELEAAAEEADVAARAAGLGSLLGLVGRDADALVAALPVVPREELLASVVPAVTVEGYGYDPQRGELWFAGETAAAVLLELDARRRALAAEADEL